MTIMAIFDLTGNNKVLGSGVSKTDSILARRRFLETRNICIKKGDVREGSVPTADLKEEEEAKGSEGGLGKPD